MSLLTDQIQTELEVWCASYVTAFEAFDAKSIGEHWAFPALIVSGEHQLIMKNADKFNQNTGALIDFYKRQNAQRVERKVLAVLPMADQSAAMQVHDKISTPDNSQLVAEWVSAYVLRRTPDGWRAIFADASGEAAAWVARGTPLGKD